MPLVHSFQTMKKYIFATIERLIGLKSYQGKHRWKHDLLKSTEYSFQ